MEVFSVDFGTTRTKSASVNAGGKAEAILNARGETFTPSVVCVTGKGPPLVGTDAQEQSYLNPEGTGRNFKMELGSTGNILGNGQFLIATDAAELVIARIKKDMEAYSNASVTECVATCPANFRDHSKQALLEAYERNGIKVLKLIPEPTAAAFAYAPTHSGSELLVAVYDFGGGTFDVSIVKIEGPQVTVVATEGIQKLGGNDINEGLVGYVLDQVAAQSGERPSPDADPLFKLDIENRIESAKISLGNRPQVPVVVSWKGNNTIVTVTQDDFQRILDPLAQQSLDALDRAIKAAGLTKDRIDDVYLAGGTSRLPQIQKTVEHHMGKPPKQNIDPDKAVVYGGALACLAEFTQQGREATHRGVFIPPLDVFLREVTGHDIGCCVVDLANSARRLVQSVIIAKNSPIPRKDVDRFYLERDDQTEARIEILQGEAGADRDDCLLIGELHLENLPPEPKRTPRIEVAYSIDANGMVTATATDTVSGQQKTTSVDYKRGIKPKDKPAAA